MRIIAHSGAPEWGGAEIALTDLLAGLAGRGHEVTLFANRSVVMERAQAKGIATRQVHLGGDIALHDAVLLSRALRVERPDALLVGTFGKLWLAALGARMAGGARVVVRVGLSTDTPSSAKYRFVTIYKGLPPQGERRSAEEARRALGLPVSGPLVGSVGRLVSKRRFDRLLEAMVFLPNDAHLAIAGEGALRAALGQLAA